MDCEGQLPNARLWRAVKKDGRRLSKRIGIPTKGLPLKRRSKGMGFLKKGFYKGWTVREKGWVS